jgi:hypothetical protein
MKAKNKKELDYVLNQAKKIGITIAVLFFTLLILTTIF